MLEQTNDLREQLIAWRRDFHMHPELSFQEFRTAKRVTEELEAMGIRFDAGVGKIGVIGHIGSGSPVIGIRADMDALPIQEANDVPYASQNPGVMHACGHDAHTSMLLGVARIFSQMADRPPGEVRLLFQPSEESWDSEGKSGAVRMIDDGAMKDVDAVIALHVGSQYPANTIMSSDGYVAASVDSFTAVIKGTGGHGAYPHLGKDPIYILAQVINAIHGIRARRIDPIQPAVISIGSVHGGSVENVIPAEVEIVGTIRSFDDAVRQQLWDELENALAVSRAFGGDYALEIDKGYPSLYNDPDVTSLISQAAVDLFGEQVLLPSERGMGAEDFAYMTRKAPGSMFILGTGLAGPLRLAHSPTFDIDESALPMGVALLAESARRLLIEKA